MSQQVSVQSRVALLEESDTPRVVVVGAGFGGLEAVKALAKYPVEVVLIDKHNYHHFTPLLYQVAAAELEVEEIVFPVRSILKKQANAKFIMAEVLRVDQMDKHVVTDKGFIPYNYLILAMGSKVDYFGVDLNKQTTFPMKSLQDGIKIRNHILSCLEKAEYEADPHERAKLLTFVVVGAGPSGVEYIGALSALVNGPLKKEFKQIKSEDVHLVLIDAGSTVLKQFHPKLSKYATYRLQKMGVDVLLDNQVVKVTPDHVFLESGTTIPTRTVIWNAGVRGHDVTKNWGFETNHKDQIIVSNTLQTNNPDIFAIGDMAILPEPLPMMAMPAIQQGKHVAQNIIRLIKWQTPEKFEYKSYGTMAVIGRNAAIVQIGGLRFKGFVAWIIWTGLHLFKLIGVRNRLNIFINWVWEYLTFDSASRVILGLEKHDNEETTFEMIPFLE